MRAIGFRVEPKQVHYVVIDVEEKGAAANGNVASHGKFAPPTTYSEAESLRWYRERIIQEIDKHKPDRAGLRYPETFGRKGVTASDHRRLRIEGVILEATESKKVQVFGGALQQINSALGSDSAKAYKDKAEIRGIKWDDLNDYCQDAVLAALASMK